LTSKAHQIRLPHAGTAFYAISHLHCGATTCAAGAARARGRMPGGLYCASCGQHGPRWFQCDEKTTDVRRWLRTHASPEDVLYVAPFADL